jgi:flavin-dependent dehydrogenase
MTIPRSTEVLILGGGPTGSTAGMILAREGIPSLLIEAERHPRFHIGESLLPHSLPMFDRLGVHDAIRSLPRTLVKPGATFCSHDGEERTDFWFDESAAPVIPNAYNVRRDEFDDVLLRAAASRGVDVREGWKAVAPEWEGSRLVGVRVRAEDGREGLIRAKCVLDATGQHAFLATRMGWKTVYPDHRKLAIVGHFEGVERASGRGAGNIVIIITHSGWYWLIPFADGTTSVGVVLDVERYGTIAGGIDAQFDAAIEATPEAARQLASARRLFPAGAVQNFSFKVSRTHGDGFAMIGDAAGFLDPIFSSGILIGMETAERAARDVASAIRSRGRVDAMDTRGSAVLSRRLQKYFFMMIRAYYDRHFIEVFLTPRTEGKPLPGARLGIRPAVTSLLAGDVIGVGGWRKRSRFRMLKAIGRAQSVARRFGGQLVRPLENVPGA